MSNELPSVRSFSYNYNGTIGGNSYSYYIRKDDDSYQLTYETQEHHEYGEMTAVIDRETVDRIGQLYVDYNLAEYDGFHGRMDGVCDGSGFSLGYSFEGDIFMSASGSNSFFPTYFEFEHALNDVLKDTVRKMKEDKRQEIISEGIKGKVNSLFFNFSEDVSEGKDRAEIHFSAFREKNTDIVLTLDSDRYLPAGRYSYYGNIENIDEIFHETDEIVRKYSLINWFNYEDYTEVSGSEWFQISLDFTEGKEILASGRSLPENYYPVKKELMNLVLKNVASYLEKR